MVPDQGNIEAEAAKIPMPANGEMAWRVQYTSSDMTTITCKFNLLSTSAAAYTVQALVAENELQELVLIPTTQSAGNSVLTFRIELNGNGIHFNAYDDNIVIFVKKQTAKEDDKYYYIELTSYGGDPTTRPKPKLNRITKRYCLFHNDPQLHACTAVPIGSACKEDVECDSFGKIGITHACNAQKLCSDEGMTCNPLNNTCSFKCGDQGKCVPCKQGDCNTLDAGATCDTTTGTCTCTYNHFFKVNQNVSTFTAEKQKTSNMPPLPQYFDVPDEAGRPIFYQGRTCETRRYPPHFSTLTTTGQIEADVWTGSPLDIDYRIFNNRNILGQVFHQGEGENCWMYAMTTQLTAYLNMRDSPSVLYKLNPMDFIEKYQFNSHLSTSWSVTEPNAGIWGIGDGDNNQNPLQGSIPMHQNSTLHNAKKHLIWNSSLNLYDDFQRYKTAKKQVYWPYEWVRGQPVSQPYDVSVYTDDVQPFYSTTSDAGLNQKIKTAIAEYGMCTDVSCLNLSSSNILYGGRQENFLNYPNFVLSPPFKNPYPQPQPPVVSEFINSNQNASNQAYPTGRASFLPIEPAYDDDARMEKAFTTTTKIPGGGYTMQYTLSGSSKEICTKMIYLLRKFGPYKIVINPTKLTNFLGFSIKGTKKQLTNSAGKTIELNGFFPDEWTMKSNRHELGHAVTLIGYNNTYTFKSNLYPFFIIQNSWGTGWGHNGYGLIPILTDNLNGPHDILKNQYTTFFTESQPCEGNTGNWDCKNGCFSGFQGNACSLSVCGNPNPNSYYSTSLPFKGVCRRGQHCDNTTNTCTQDLDGQCQCQNGGTCGDGYWSNECNCPMGWIGAACELPQAGYTGNDPNVCITKGMDPDNNCDTCENGNKIDDKCVSNKCKNHSAWECRQDADCTYCEPCPTGRGGSECTLHQCSDGWTGDLCQTPVCDAAHACMNGGTCVSPNTCSCIAGWTGVLCAVKEPTIIPQTPLIDFMWVDPFAETANASLRASNSLPLYRSLKVEGPKTPLILIPGLASSRVYAKYTGWTKPECYFPVSSASCSGTARTTQDTWEKEWVEAKYALSQNTNWRDLLMMKFDDTNNFIEPENVEKTAWREENYDAAGFFHLTEDFGGVEGCATLLDIGKWKINPEVAWVWQSLILYLQTTAGYVAKESVFGAPYDFSKITNQNYMFKYCTRLKHMIELAYTKNGDKKVVIASHSLGCPVTNVFFNWGLSLLLPNTADNAAQVQAWKNKYVKMWIPIAGPFGGAMKACRTVMKGDALALPGATAAWHQEYQKLNSGIVWMTPDPIVFKNFKICQIIGEGTEYTADTASVVDMYTASDNADTARAYEFNTLPWADYVKQAPGVDVLVVTSSCTTNPTEGSQIYTKRVPNRYNPLDPPLNGKFASDYNVKTIDERYSYDDIFSQAPTPLQIELRGLGHEFGINGPRPIGDMIGDGTVPYLSLRVPHTWSFDTNHGHLVNYNHLVGGKECEHSGILANKNMHKIVADALLID